MVKAKAKTAEITARLAGLGGAKWDLHTRARALRAAGKDIVEMTIGEPDAPTPPELIDIAVSSMRSGRTGYSDGRGELGLRRALAERYTAQTGRVFGPENILCFPGTQTALFAAMMGVAEAGDQVLVGDPMYATYEAVIRATGAEMVRVPLRAEKGFRLQPQDLAARITPRSRAVLLNTPHNPTGAILTRDELAAIGALAQEHDLWIICDEVYDQLVFEGAEFVSPLALPALADRVITVSSISKSHAAPGFRSGWCVASAAFCDALLPVSEAMLFGNQPFIADMTEAAVRQGSALAVEMGQSFAVRAKRVAERLSTQTDLRAHCPDAGFFVLIDVSETGLNGSAYAWDLLENAGVAVMPGTSFGTTLDSWVRLALSVSDQKLEAGLDRIIAHRKALSRGAA